MLELLELGHSLLIILDPVDLAKEFSPEAELDKAVRFIHFEKANQHVEKRASLIDNLVQLAEPDFDENTCELISFLEISRCNDLLNVLLQCLVFRDDDIDEGLKVFLWRLTDGHELDDAVDRHFQI